MTDVFDLLKGKPGDSDYEKKGVIVQGITGAYGSLHAKNMMALLKLLIKEGELVFDLDDEIILNTTITKDGEIISPLLQTN